MARFIDVWITCPDRQTAERIAEDLLTDRLAACTNMFAPVTSRYWWEGKIETSEEVPLLIKTRAEHFDAVCAAVQALHPDTVPGIVATEICDVSQDYADWLRRETREPA